MPDRTRHLLAILAAVALLGLAGCGSDDGAGGDGKLSSRLVDFSQKPPFVNALDVDPADGSFLLTTNKGFWRIDKEGETVRKQRSTVRAGSAASPVGTFLYAMFTGPGKLIGSGHPDDQRSKLPQFLGVLRSDDNGRTWQVVSRLGDADLHSARIAHGRMYAFDAVLGAMLISRDQGETFTERFTPKGLVIDFVVDPEDPEYLLAATEDQLFRSEDEARRWRPLLSAEGIRLAWPAAGALYRADKDGTFQKSDDRGESWDQLSRLEGEPYKIKAMDAEHLFVALSDGTIVESTDGGRGWETVFEP